MSIKSLKVTARPLVPGEFDVELSKSYLANYARLTNIEFIGAAPLVISPKGYAVKLSWTLYFLDRNTGVHWSIPEYPSGFAKIGHILEDAGMLLQTKWLPIEYCLERGISINNQFTAYIRKGPLIRIV